VREEHGHCFAFLLCLNNQSKLTFERLKLKTNRRPVPIKLTQRREQDFEITPVWQSIVLLRFGKREMAHYLARATSSLSLVVAAQDLLQPQPVQITLDIDVSADVARATRCGAL
jgi:hypothetical protein